MKKSIKLILVLFLLLTTFLTYQVTIQKKAIDRYHKKTMFLMYDNLYNSLNPYRNQSPTIVDNLFLVSKNMHQVTELSYMLGVKYNYSSMFEADSNIYNSKYFQAYEIALNNLIESAEKDPTSVTTEDIKLLNNDLNKLCKLFNFGEKDYFGDYEINTLTKDKMHKALIKTLNDCEFYKKYVRKVRETI